MKSERSGEMIFPAGAVTNDVEESLTRQKGKSQSALLGRKQMPKHRPTTHAATSNSALDFDISHQR